jgi:Na+-driven multidrug efflux pump
MENTYFWTHFFDFLILICGGSGIISTSKQALKAEKADQIFWIFFTIIFLVGTVCLIIKYPS